MKRRISLSLLVVSVAALLSAQILPDRRPGLPDDRHDTRLPSGKRQSDEILKAEHERNLDDAAELMKLTEDLKLELEKNDRFVLSLGALKKTEEIEKLAKRIRGRLKRF